MRLSRVCYDKPHRCPGGRGGGWKYAAMQRCAAEFGHISVFGSHPLVGLRTLWFGRCDACDVVTWPAVTRYFDPTWWRHPIFHRPLWTYRLEAWLRGWRRG